MLKFYGFDAHYQYNWFLSFKEDDNVALHRKLIDYRARQCGMLLVDNY